MNPLIHSCYAPRLTELVPDLVALRSSCREDEIDMIDRRIVAATWWLVLQPDNLARKILETQRWSVRHPISVAQAAFIILALGEAGFPITGNGAPDYPDDEVPYDLELGSLYPVRGSVRDRTLMEAARYWALMASKSYTYVSFGSSQGFTPRPVQYDQPGSMNPSQQASLTFGPLADRNDECDTHSYIRRHTRLLILVRPRGVLQ